MAGRGVLRPQQPARSPNGRCRFTIWNHAPITIEDPVHDPQRKTITSQLFVVCESLPCEPLGHSLWEVAGFGRAEIVGKWNVSVVEIYKLVHYRE